jgi:peptide/nickel transport system permease protein
MRNFIRVLRTAPITAWVGLLTVAIYVVAAVFAPALAPHGETEIVGKPYEGWGSVYLLGTDNLGRDVLSRLLFGGRNSMGIALLIVSLTFLLGGTSGLFAAAIGGWIDQAVSRLVDILMAIPQIIFALLFLSILGNSDPVLIGVITVSESTRVFRLARAASQNIVTMDFIEAAWLRGDGMGWVIRRELLPNVLPPLMAEFGLRFCFVFLLISGLSFLGLGVQPPAAIWGSMVRDNATLITYGDMTPLVPAGAIAILAIGVNFIVDWLQDLAIGLTK